MACAPFAPIGEAATGWPARHPVCPLGGSATHDLECGVWSRVPVQSLEPNAHRRAPAESLNGQCRVAQSLPNGRRGVPARSWLFDSPCRLGAAAALSTPTWCGALCRSRLGHASLFFLQRPVAGRREPDRAWPSDQQRSGRVALLPLAWQTALPRHTTMRFGRRFISPQCGPIPIYEAQPGVWRARSPIETDIPRQPRENVGG